MSSRRSNYWWIWPAAFVVIVIIIVIYLASLGSITITDKEDLPKELTDSKEDALRKHEMLKQELDKKTSLKKKLAKRFRVVYACVRLTLVALWLGPIYILFHVGVIRELGDALNYSEASLFVILILNFVTFGNLTNLDAFLTLIKARVENWVWLRNLDLEADINNMQLEMDNLAKTIEQAISVASLPPGDGPTVV